MQRAFTFPNHNPGCWQALSHLWQSRCQYSTRHVGLLGKTLQASGETLTTRKQRHSVETGSVQIINTVHSDTCIHPYTVLKHAIWALMLLYTAAGELNLKWRTLKLANSLPWESFPIFYFLARQLFEQLTMYIRLATTTLRSCSCGGKERSLLAVWLISCMTHRHDSSYLL